MATPINPPLNGDIWHLSIDDLLAPLPEKTRLGGPGPFVINLSASSAPIDLPVTSFAGCEHAHIYQVQRTEDRRPRYRLRLGPFANEDLAEAILAKVREIYPSALTATADAEDLRAMKALHAKENPPQPAPPLGVASKPAAAKPAALSPPVLTSEYKAAVRAPAPAVPVLVPAAVLAPAAPRIAAVAPAAPAPKSAAAALAAPALKSAAAAPAAPALKTAAAAPAAPASKPPVVREAVQIRRGVPSLESTQTVRALTQLELEDEQASRWFVIQLSLAEDAFDPDTVPNLDIFSVYRLYSVAGIDQGRIVHALRVGFFSEDTAAAAVATYLAAFYDNPTVKRVSSAERRRFAEQPLQPRKDVGSTGKQAVIEITNERYIREKRGGHASGK
jgi:hypothetical protein